MSFLAFGLPEEYEGFPLYPDFRNMISLDLLLKDPELSEEEKASGALDLLYARVPDDIDLAIEGLVWFYTRGQNTQENVAEASTQSSSRAFDFEQDEALIISAFLSAYGIHLTSIDFLHWWEFMALFETLPENTLLRKVMYWRTCDLSKLPKEEKKYVASMRNIYCLKENKASRPVSIEEAEAQFLAGFNNRYREADAMLAKNG